MKNRPVPVTRRSVKEKLRKRGDHQKLISKVHHLNKLNSQLKRTTDPQVKHQLLNQVQSVQRYVEALGGLDTYQLASQVGEKNFNSALILEQVMKLGWKFWFETLGRKLNLLDVGALAENYTKNNYLQVEAIDLNPQLPSIKKVDFLTYKLPLQKFDIVSLSLVLNFAGLPELRGDMLKKVPQLLVPNLPTFQKVEQSKPMGLKLEGGGLLYLVLPKPCLNNSRYLTLDKLNVMLQSLQLEIRFSKESNKLTYLIYQFCPKANQPKNSTLNFKKLLIKDGKNLNNFSIIL